MFGCVGKDSGVPSIVSSVTSPQEKATYHLSLRVHTVCREQSTTAVLWNICPEDTFFLGNIKDDRRGEYYRRLFKICRFCLVLGNSFVLCRVQPIMGFFFSPPSFWPGKNILPRKSSCRTLLAGKLSRSLLAGRIEQIYFPSSSLTALSLYIPLSVCCLAGFSSRQDGEFRQVFILEGWKLQKVHCSYTPPTHSIPVEGIVVSVAPFMNWKSSVWKGKLRSNFDPRLRSSELFSVRSSHYKQRLHP